MDPYINTISQRLTKRSPIVQSQNDSPTMVNKTTDHIHGGATMTAARFLKHTAMISLLAVVSIILVNVTIDIYGLFLPVKGKALPIYNNERLSKYLLSYRYIPQNYNAAIIGTSLSANLDVKANNTSAGPLKIYNASVMGANISEISPIAENLMHRGVRKMIICFSPYMVKNSGSKEIEFGPKLYFGALGSKNLYETYAVGLIRHFELMPGKFPKNQIDEFGVNHYGELFKVNDVKKKIDTVIGGTRNTRLTLDPKAMEELTDLLAALKKNNVKLIGYFHPVPADVFESKKEDYEAFESKVRQVVGDDFRLINFNSSSFRDFTCDYSNYIDHGHFSEKGQKIITSILVDELAMLP
jgi:hypothetical protein